MNLANIRSKLQGGKTLSAVELRLLDEIEETEGGAGGAVIVDTRVHLAKILDVHPRTIKRWVDDGMPVMQGGKYNLIEIVEWCRSTNRKLFEDEETDQEINWDKENKKWRALIRKLEYRELQGELVRREEVIAAFVQRWLIVKSGLLGASKTLAPLVAVETDNAKCASIIDGHMRMVLGDFAGGGLLGRAGFDDVLEKVKKIIEKGFTTETQRTQSRKKKEKKLPGKKKTEKKKQKNR